MFCCQRGESWLWPEMTVYFIGSESEREPQTFRQLSCIGGYHVVLPPTRLADPVPFLYISFACVSKHAGAAHCRLTPNYISFLSNKKNIQRTLHKISYIHSSNALSPFIYLPCVFIFLTSS